MRNGNKPDDNNKNVICMHLQHKGIEARKSVLSIYNVTKSYMIFLIHLSFS